MPLRNARELTFRPTGVCDTVDGTNIPPGAMQILANLIPDPKTDHNFIARPAAELVIDFAPFLAAGFESGRLVVGDKAYGMIATGRNAGRDEPYCYDMAAGAFVTVQGVTSANSPLSPPATGAWTPPIIAQVASRVIVTHPGFPGGATKFGWFDVSGFSETVLGNTHSSVTIDGDPSILGVQPGMLISGSGIPANTSVDATEPFVLTTSGTLSLNTLSLLGTTVGVAVGQAVASLGIPNGTTVAAITPSTSLWTGETHTSTLLDNLVFVSGGPPLLPTIGDGISGTGIPANTEVVAVGTVTISALAGLNTTTTIQVDVSSGIVAGQGVSGFGIPAGALVVSATPFSLTTSGDISALSSVVINLASTTGVVAGQAVTGFGIPTTMFGAPITVVVVSVDSPTQVTLSSNADQTVVADAITFSGTAVVLDNAATTTANFVSVTFSSLSVTMSKAASASASGVSITFTENILTLSSLSLLDGPQVVQVTFSGGTITLSAAATSSANGVSLTIAGGTVASPLWGAGDCDRNALPSVPLGVMELNGRAYFADGLDGIPFSDSGLPCRRSNQPNVEALTTNDGLPVTAIAPLMLSAPITGGIVQAAIAFQGSNKMRQITGDMATGDLKMNLLPVATGSDAPLSIIPTDIGTMFVSPEGLRLINFDGTVSPPIGDAGKGIAMPFIHAVEPSRICAAANADVIRITTQNHDAGDSYEEYWFDLTRKVFTGPHTSTASLIQPWRNTFLMSFAGVNAQIYRSDSEPDVNRVSSYDELNATLSWAYQPSLLPDSGDGQMVCVQEMTLACALGADNPADAIFISDMLELLDTTQVIGDDEAAALWNAFNWNQNLWNRVAGVNFRQRNVGWNIPLVFKQGAPQFTGTSNGSVRIGNLYMKYQRLGYKLQEAS